MAKRENLRPLHTSSKYLEGGLYGQPETPPPERGAGAARNRPALRDAFADSPYATEGASSSSSSRLYRERKDSHELTWSPSHQRHSLFDNMLLSLDQGTDIATLLSDSNARGNRNFHSRSRGHTFSSSISSDNSYILPDSPQSKQVWGKRSDSSTFRATLRRIDSGRTTYANKARAGEDQKGAHGTQSYGGRPVSGRHGSRSSGSSSVDHGHMMGGPRWQQSFTRRSSSFDQGYTRGDLGTGIEDLALRMAKIGRPETPDFDDPDVAPTPTVPTSSRRYQPQPSTSALHTATSTATTATISNFLPSGENSKTPISHHNSVNISASIAALDTQTLGVGRSEDRGMTPPSEISSNRQVNVSSPQVPSIVGREKAGFFRRVFGAASRNTTPTAVDMPLPRSESNVRATARLEDSSQTPQSNKTAPAIPSDIPKTPAKDPVLNKKASFFRRRKKSISEPSVPVLPSFSPQWHDQPPRAVGESPTSSLRDAMNPYLHNRSESDARPMSKPGYRAASIDHTTVRCVPNSDISYSIPTQHLVSELSARPGSQDASQSKCLEHVGDDQDVKQMSVTPGCAPGPIRQDEVSSAKRKVLHKHRRTSSDINKDLPILPGPENASSPRSLNVANGQDVVTPSRSSSKKWQSKLDASVSGKLLPLQAHSLAFHESIALQQPTRMGAEEPLSLMPPRDHSTDSRLTGSSVSDSDYKSAKSKPQSPSDEGPPVIEILSFEPNVMSIDKYTDPSLPTVEDRARAEQLYSGRGDVDKAELAAWLGEDGTERAKLRRAYMELFDWKDLSILTALRGFCSNMRLKGESQQVDRVLDAMSVRWCDCNPSHGFVTADVVHTITYSIVMLNTDLHIAETDQKMTRNEFLKNTVPVLRRIVKEIAPEAFEPPTKRGSMLPPPRPSADTSHQGFMTASIRRNSNDGGRPTCRLSSRPSSQSFTEDFSANASTTVDFDPPADGCGPLVKVPFRGKLSAWETQIEVILKEFYNSIRQQSLPLYGSVDRARNPGLHPPQSSKASVSSNVLRRSPSTLSRTSEKLTHRGRGQNFREAARWSSKTRSRPRLYAPSVGELSRTSLDDDMSGISPAASSLWSKYSWGRTAASTLSVNSLSSDFPQGDYKQSIGFANALSQAIIREDATADSEEHLRAAPLLDDESLELAGAPWAKEGNLKHKHHLEGGDKKSRDRNWTECFAVIEKGWVRLFQFNSQKAIRQKSKALRSGGVVGGGNWMDNAEALDEFLLRQTIASALPSPGYSKTRPHVWALSLPTGAVHLFQAGTPEIVREYVSTANYWSARLSKEPLVGGISNIEYGWSEHVINLALVVSKDATPVPTPAASGRRASVAGNARPSMQSSIRSSLDQGGSLRPKLPGDKVVLSDWTPPTQSMLASALMEVDQLKALSTYVASVKAELERHNELRPAILLAFSPRHPNHSKAMANFERKSSYLLREIVKFSTYVECLNNAGVAKERVLREKREREVELRRERAEADHEEGERENEEEHDEDGEDEPATP